MAAVSAMKPGIGGVVYRNTGTYGTPVWVAQSLVKDVKLPVAWDFAEAGSRETRAKLFVKTRADVSASITMRVDDANVGYLAFRANAVNNNPNAVLDLMILDGLITVEGVHGIRAEFTLSVGDHSEDIDGSIYDTFDCKPAWTANGYPSSVIMGAASTPAFIAF